MLLVDVVMVVVAFAPVCQLVAVKVVGFLPFAIINGFGSGQLVCSMANFVGFVLDVIYVADIVAVVVFISFA